MATLGKTFNQNDMPQSEQNFDPIPAGQYQVGITSAELKNTKDGTGQYINIRYDVTAGDYSGRVVFGMLNIVNKNPEAERIGHEQLGQVMRAIGLDSLTDTDQLIGAQLIIKVKIQDDDQYGAQNRVTSWKALAGGSAPQPSAKAAPVATKKPWEK